MKPIVFTLLFILLLAGCPKNEKASSARIQSVQEEAYAVYDSFETGAGTYTRSLAVDGPFLWVGYSGGALKIQRTSGVLLQSFGKKDGLKSPYIFTISVSSDGTKWFGTNAGGLSRFSSSEALTTWLPPGIADSWVYNIAYQKDGVMWIGTWNGVSRFDGKAFTNFRVKDGLVNPWVYAVAVDRDESVWMGTEGGLNRFYGNKWETWTHKNGLGADNLDHLNAAPSIHNGSEKLEDINLAQHRHNLNTADESGKETYNENYIFSLLIDSEGVKWIGTWGGGLARFDGKSWKNYTTRDGLAGNVVYSISKGVDGELWIGTNHGLSRFKENRFTNWTQKEGLLSEDIYTVTQDPDRFVWLGHKGGVTRIVPKSKLVSPHPSPVK